jgi:hypothetical protein
VGVDHDGSREVKVLLFEDYCGLYLEICGAMYLLLPTNN